MGQNEISFCLATSNFSAGDHDMVFRSWKMQAAGNPGSSFVPAKAEMPEDEEMESQVMMQWSSHAALLQQRAGARCVTQPRVFGCWLSKVKFESLTAPDVTICLRQMVDLSVKLCGSACLLLNLFPNKCFQSWVCWWTLARMSVLWPQALPISLEWSSWVITHSPNCFGNQKELLAMRSCVLNPVSNVKWINKYNKSNNNIL